MTDNAVDDHPVSKLYPSERETKVEFGFECDPWVVYSNQFFRRVVYRFRRDAAVKVRVKRSVPSGLG